MPEMLSPGVFVTEIDASTIVPTVSNSIAVFGGNFLQGPVGTHTIITNVADLISYYGEPKNSNYSDWYQAYNFLQYGNKLLVSRAANVGGSFTDSTADFASITDNVLTVSVADIFSVGDIISLDEIESFVITAVDTTLETITLDRNYSGSAVAGDTIYFTDQTRNGTYEAVSTSGTKIDNTNKETLFGEIQIIENATDFETKESSIAFSDAYGKLKIMARNPGAWSDNLEIAIANADIFGSGNPTMAFDGINIDDLFEYAPSGTEVGIVVKLGNQIVETWTVDFDETAKDYNNKSMYIENVINNQSSYIFVKDNTANAEDIQNFCFSINGTEEDATINLYYGADSSIQADDLLDAYDIFSNKEEIDIDIVIGNELDAGGSAKSLVETREDCIAFVGAAYADIVGKKAATATSNLITWRKTGDLNYNSMFMVACANYKYQYDRYNDKYRWINIAGDIVGLRAQTSMNRASWWASAGLERGQVKNVTKLAFNPTQGQRDLLYKNGLNPIVAFPGQGTVMWGQKTLLDKPSSFDRVNVRGLFNTMERALSKMAKYQVMEFNDNFTRNRIVSMIKPYLSTVQAGRGIQDFLVICDESNNTADVVSRNQLVVDIYIKPTYVAEFIQLRFTNAGTNSFSEVIGG